MPGWDLEIDPITRDYIDDGHGAFKTTVTAETAIYHQFMTHRNRWAGDPDAGCRLYQLPRKLSDENVRTAIDMCKEAMAPLLAAGLVADYHLSTERDQRGRLGIVGTVEDTQAGELDITPLLPGGA